jgi:hypothetical protein
MRTDARGAIDAYEAGEDVGEQRLVQARVVQWALDDLDAEETTTADD